MVGERREDSSHAARIIVYWCTLRGPLSSLPAIQARIDISRAIQRIRSTWLSTRALDIPDPPNLPLSRPLQRSTNGAPDQSKHSNAKLVFENIEWLVARWRNEGGWMSMFFYASTVRARTDFGRVIFLLKKKMEKGFPAMSHVCRTWKTPDNTSEIGAVIDITGRRVCPIAFCSCKVLPRKSHPPSSISLRSPSDNRISRTRRIRGVDEIWRASRQECKISFPFCIWVFLVIRIRRYERRKETEERINRRYFVDPLCNLCLKIHIWRKNIQGYWFQYGFVMIKE